MSDLYVYTLFEKNDPFDSGRPRCTGIRAGNETRVFDIYRPGARRTIEDIEKDINSVKQIILRSLEKGHRVIISDFKNHLIHFQLPLPIEPYNVYDLHLPYLKKPSSKANDHGLVQAVIQSMMAKKIKQYHKLFANAAVMYQDLENRGLIFELYEHVYSAWSQKTFTGRSKTTGFLVQGQKDPCNLTPPWFDQHDVIIHFDWICADIRIASLLSGDENLNEAYKVSDPYTYMMDKLNSEYEQTVTRAKCKKHLLSAVNRLDHTDVALTEIYPRLGKWIGESKEALEKIGFTKTILDRVLKVADHKDKNPRAVLNGVMQGSVAHAMHNAGRKIWELMSDRLIAEIHDSIAVISKPDKISIKNTIDTIAPIMLHPFAGILDSNPVFPFNVSIGKRWKEWQIFRVYHESGFKSVKAPKRDEESPEEDSGDAQETSQIDQEED